MDQAASGLLIQLASARDSNLAIDRPPRTQVAKSIADMIMMGMNASVPGLDRCVELRKKTRTPMKANCQQSPKIELITTTSTVHQGAEQIAVAWCSFQIDDRRTASFVLHIALPKAGDFCSFAG